MPRLQRPIDGITDRLFRECWSRARRRHARPYSIAPRETLLTLMLGTLSTTLGVVVLSVLLAGFLGASLAPWSEQKEILTESKPRRYEKVLDPDTDTIVWKTVMVVGAVIIVPTRYCYCLAMLGAVLGAITTIPSLRRRRQLPPLAATSLVLCALAMLGTPLYEIVLMLIY